MQNDEESNPHVTGTTRRRFLSAAGFLTLGGATTGLWRLLSTAVDDSPPLAEQATVASPRSTTTVAALPSVDTTQSTLQQPTTATERVDLTVEVICRDAWGAEPARPGAVPHEPVRLTLHHTAVEQSSTSQGPSRARQHQTFHLSRGWPDLAYHFLVDRLGTIYEGRAVDVRGDTGTEYDPDGHFLVCLEGDFNVQEPTQIQVDRAAQVFAWASQAFGIDPATLAGHSTYADTTCPGDSVEKILASGSMVEAITSSPGIELIDLCGAAGLATVETIESSTAGPDSEAPTTDD